MREHIYKGNTLLQRRDYDGAIAEYEAALLVDPSNTTARDNIVLTHNNWGIELFRQKKYDDAREQWNTALKLNPYDRNAKNNLNVLKTTLARLGPAAIPASADPKDQESANEGDTKSGPSIMPKGSRTAKEDNTPVPNAVVLGRQSSGSSTSAAVESSSNNTATTNGASGGVVILNSGNRSSGGSSSSSSSGAQIVASPSVSSQTAPAVSSPPVSSATVTTSTSTSASTLGGANIDDKLSALESKVYGRASRDVPLLQRLERLERDTSSRPSLGSISDRVQTLLKTYGL